MTRAVIDLLVYFSAYYFACAVKQSIALFNQVILTGDELLGPSGGNRRWRYAL
jgi:hypothetical protein